MNIFLIIILSVIFLMLVALFFWLNDLEQNILKIQNIKELCSEIKSSNNRKLEDISQSLNTQSSKINDNHKVIVNYLTNLSKDTLEIKNNISVVNKNLGTIKSLIFDTKTNLNSLSDEFQQNLVNVYHSNNDWLDKNIKELLSNDTQLKQKSETLGNNFIKYNSELQQKFDYLKKEQIENWKQHLEYLKSFEEKILETEIINGQIQKTVLDIEKQEQILNGMIKQHTAIADYSKEIIESQEGIVKLLEALMLDSLTKEIDNIKK